MTGEIYFDDIFHKSDGYVDNIINDSSDVHVDDAACYKYFR